MPSLIPLPFDATTYWMFLVWSSYNLSVRKNKSLQTFETIAVDCSALLHLYEKYESAK